MQLPIALNLAHSLARQLIHQRDPRAMAQLVVDGLIETFRYDHAAFLLFDEERDIARVEAEAGHMTKILPGVGYEMAPGVGVVGATIRTGESYLTLDTASDPCFTWPAAGPPARSELCVAVKSPSRVLGVLDLMSFTPGFYSDIDQVLVEILAGHLGMAIEYALLTNNLELRVAARTAELETLVDISSQLLAAGQLEQVLQTVIAHGPRIAPWARRTIVLLYDPVERGLLPIAGVAEEEKRGLPIFAAGNRGVVGSVFNTGKPLLCTSPDEAVALLEGLPEAERGRMLALSGGAAPQALACVPLQIEQTAIGVLLGVASQPARDVEETLAPLQTLANLAALSIEHARLLEREQAQRNSALTLLHLSSLVAASLSLEQVQERIVELAMAQFSAQAVWLFLYDAERDQLVLASARGWPRRREDGPPLRPNEGIAGRILRSRAIVCVPDIAKEPSFLLRQDATQAGLRTMAGAPLIAQDEVVGVLCLATPRLLRDGELDPDLRTLLTIFTNQAAMAVANAHLHEKTLRQAREAQMLAEASQRFATSLERERVAEAIAEETRRLLGALCALVLVTGRGNHLYLAACSLGGADAGPALPEDAAEALSAMVEERMGGAQPRAPVLLETSRLPAPLAHACVDGLLAVPLSLHNRFLGALLVGCYGAPRPAAATAPAAGSELLFSLAERAALALENTRLYQDQAELLVELKELQSHLVRSESLAATGRLAASLAHEINNPLAIIRASLGMARTRLDQNHAAWLELSDIDEELDRISRITRSLLDFSRSPAPSSEQTDLNQVIDTLVRVIQPRLERQRIELVWLPDAGSPLLDVPVDSLKQIVLNLVTNAIDAMPNGGRLTLRTRQSDKYVGTSISDTGVGIPPNELGRVFDPFFTTKRDGGTGLGLAIIDRLVRTYGGDVEVESSLGKGSTFRVRLPLATSHEV